MTSSIAPRTDRQWDITTGVGKTALAAAAVRDAEGRRPDALVRDPYAAAFLAASGATFPDPDDPAVRPTWSAAAMYIGVRSRFFDDALAAPAASGITQVVLLAAGLDVRAHRMDWPPSVTVFELDAPAVLAFKDRVLAERGAAPRVRRVPVAVDFRENWTEPLCAAGLDPFRPAAWLAEGLLAYLPADAERSLFERVQSLSAPGSRFVGEDLRPFARAIDEDPGLLPMSSGMVGSDMRELFQGALDDRSAGWFEGHGWPIVRRQVGPIAERHGRRIPGVMADVLASIEMFQAERVGSGAG